jgi:integrase
LLLPNTGERVVIETTENVGIPLCGLSQSDQLRLAESMIDEDGGVIRLTGGRTKTGIRQTCPLTLAVREILAVIHERNRTKKIVPINGLVFVGDDGQPITRNSLYKAHKLACKRSHASDFTWHDWAASGIDGWRQDGKDAKIAMRALGHKSVAMYLKYTHVQDSDVAETFGTGPKTSRFYNRFTREKERAAKE